MDAGRWVVPELQAFQGGLLRLASHRLDLTTINGRLVPSGDWRLQELEFHWPLSGCQSSEGTVACRPVAAFHGEVQLLTRTEKYPDFEVSAR